MSSLSQSVTTSRRKTRTYDVTDIAALVSYLEEYLTPIGTVIQKLTDTSPGPAWVLMDGRSLSKTEYPDLYAELLPLIVSGALSETASTFTIPDGEDTYLTGVGVLGEGETAGANSLTLSVDQMPSHGHTLNESPHGHTFSGTPHNHAITDPGHGHGLTDPGHDHDVAFNGVSTTTAGGASDRLTSFDLAGTFSTGQTSTETTGVTVNSGTTGVTVANGTAGGTIGTGTTGITMDAAGGGQAVDNRPKSLAVHHFIKARV